MFLTMTAYFIIFFLCALLILLFYTPESVWEQLYAYICNGQRSITLKVTNLFESEASRGQKLMREIYQLERSLICGRRDQKTSLSNYKHYTTFLYELLELNRRLGIPLKQALTDLKHNLKKEQQFSRQWESLKNGGIAQIFILFFISWVFFESSRRILEQDFQLAFSALLFFIQAIGLGLYLLFIKYLNKGAMGSLKVLEKIVQQLSILKGSGLSSHKILELVDLEQCEFLHFSQHDLRDQLLEMIVAWRESGAKLESECLGMLEEIEFRQELYRQKALTQEKGVKFMIFALFFVVPYFLFLGGLMTSLFL
jgi:hypothetical protein